MQQSTHEAYQQDSQILGLYNALKTFLSQDIIMRFWVQICDLSSKSTELVYRDVLWLVLITRGFVSFSIVEQMECEVNADRC